MSSPYLGFIYMFGGNFAPKNYALCNGALLSIQQNQALFALLGTTYGGNGVTNFQLPNLQSRLPLGFDQGLGLSFYNIGQTGGASSVTLNATTVPAHAHTFSASTSAANTTSATIANNLVPGTPSVTNAEFYATSGPPPLPPLIPEALGSGVLTTIGGSQPHTNLMPTLCITFTIALAGVFPSRN